MRSFARRQNLPEQKFVISARKSQRTAALRFSTMEYTSIALATG
jgi:hypothetical protein